jgi:hypothetical protein
MIYEDNMTNDDHLGCFKFLVLINFQIYGVAHTPLTNLLLEITHYIIHNQ